MNDDKHLPNLVCCYSLRECNFDWLLSFTNTTSLPHFQESYVTCLNIISLFCILHEHVTAKFYLSTLASVIFASVLLLNDLIARPFNIAAVSVLRYVYTHPFLTTLLLRHSTEPEVESLHHELRRGICYYFHVSVPGVFKCGASL